MMEIWERLAEFPTYKVSTYGNVLNDETGRYLKQSLTRTGLVKVGLVRGGVQHTRSVGLLVAETFVNGRDAIFDTPVHLDGDKTNNYVENIVWRPRWFAWRYSRQFVLSTIHHDRGPIIDDNGDIYKTFLDAAVKNGILVDDIWKCIIYKKPVFPTSQTFKLVK